MAGDVQKYSCELDQWHGEVIIFVKDKNPYELFWWH
jgi:hypothetical protein